MMNLEVLNGKTIDSWRGAPWMHGEVSGSYHARPAKENETYLGRFPETREPPVLLITRKDGSEVLRITRLSGN